jgi:transcriptional regulator with PAS, ATPase and Fis domain
LRKIVRNISVRVALGRQVNSLSRLAVCDYENVWQMDNMIGTEALKTIFEKAERVATTSDSTVLILGETGTGKGMLAKALHRLSRRAGKPFVEVNCSAIPAQLIESEIFGYEKGAFTDAKIRKPGLLEIADRGTVFFDEIGDMEVNLQSKLLKVIEDKEFRPLGGAHTVSVDVRIIAATSRDLRALARAGKFREDLYYRLSVVPITMPPLREHKASILPLVDYFLDVFRKEMGKKVSGFSPAARERLKAHTWPGNVRELRNCIERSIILANDEVIDEDSMGVLEGHLGAPEAGAGSDGTDEMTPMSLAECEKRLITTVLKSVDGNRNKAADVLKIHRTTLYKKIEEYGL